MRKRRLQLMLVIVMCLLLLSSMPCFAQAEAVYDEKTFTTSLCEDHYLNMVIDGDKLTISGVLSRGIDNGFSMLLEVGGTKEHYDIPYKKFFTISARLRGITDSTPLILYSNINDGRGYWSFVYHSIYIERDGSDGYKFTESPVLENNLKAYEPWLNPADGLNDKISPEVKALSDKIVAGEDSDYEKVAVLYDWVVENISYDWDSYTGHGEYKTTLADVLENKRSVCAGYANVLEALIQAQGIPCIQTSTYSLGASTKGVWDKKNAETQRSNHVHNEAYINGRWIIMDATWDSNNKYENGEYHMESPNCYAYFDMSNQFLAGNHKIIRHQSAWDENVPSTWAQDEVKEAFDESLVPYDLQSSYRSEITRKEFCQLAVNMLMEKNDTDMDGIMDKYAPTQAATDFSDVSDQSVTIANSLGIVNGRGSNKFAPDECITRQEAAAMIKRCAQVMGIKNAGADVTFGDSDSFATWAKDAIAFVAGLSDNQGNIVMGGTGKNKFSPYNTYTREQAILTIERLYNCAE